MDKRINQIIVLFKKDLGLFLSIGFGVFLFVLFFQPFLLDRFDFNNRLLFVSGLGAIVFLFMVLVRVVLPLFIGDSDADNLETTLPAYVDSFVILALSSVAFAFYLHYVGMVDVSFYLMFKVILICLAPPVVLRLNDVLKELKRQNELLIAENKTLQKQAETYLDDYLNKSIEFVSENGTENLNLLIADVACIKSADNYVEILYKEGDGFKKKLIRNTLKTIEQQISPYSNFIRCHRTWIVNIHHVEKFNKNYNNPHLTVKGYVEEIPVSRQYLLRCKEVL